MNRPRFLIILALLVTFAHDTWARGKQWQRFDNCELIRDEAYDGDSFHVRSNGQHYLFRLYFVDAPETDSRYPDRIKTQAKYFGLTDSEALQVGKAAAQFTEQTLSRRRFTILTKKENARGESKKKRYYAYVLLDDKSLGDELVANGLARVYGYKSKGADNTPVGQQYSKLKRLEEIAKTQKVGAWGFKSGGLQKRVQSQEKFERDSFDRFFHPEKFASPSPAATPSR